MQLPSMEYKQPNALHLLQKYEKGSFNHWVDLFSHFDSFFEKYVKQRFELQLDVNFLDDDSTFPREKEFAREQGVEIVDTNYFITAENKERLEQARISNSIKFDYHLPVFENAIGKPHENGLLPTIEIQGLVAISQYLRF